MHAAALGRTPQRGQVLTALDQRAAELEAGLPAGTTASVVRWMPEGPLVMSGGLMAGRLQEDERADLRRALPALRRLMAVLEEGAQERAASMSSSTLSAATGPAALDQ